MKSNFSYTFDQLYPDMIKQSSQRWVQIFLEYVGKMLMRLHETNP